MDLQRLEKNLFDNVLEAQLKLGYEGRPMSLNYTSSSLKHLTGTDDIEKALEWENISIEEHISRYIADGLSKKDAVKKVAKDRGVSKQEIYKYSIDM